MRRWGRNSWVRQLAATDLFAGISPKTVARAARCLTEIDVEDGRTLIAQGSVGREFFVIRSGSVVLCVDGQPIGMLGAGDWVGEIALLHDTTRTASVVAAERCRLLVANRSEFWSILRSDPELAARIEARADARLAALDERLTVTGPTNDPAVGDSND